MLALRLEVHDGMHGEKYYRAGMPGYNLTVLCITVQDMNGLNIFFYCLALQLLMVKIFTYINLISFNMSIFLSFNCIMFCDDMLLCCWFSCFCHGNVNGSVLSHRHFITSPFYYMTILSHGHFVIWPFYHMAILPHGRFIPWSFYDMAILSHGHFITLPFYHMAILPNGYFITWPCSIAYT